MGTDLADLKLLNNYKKEFWFLLCNIDTFSKYKWVIPSKDKNGITITSVFQKILDESHCKPEKIWVNKDTKFYNRSKKSWLEDNDIESYLLYNEGKSVAAE